MFIRFFLRFFYLFLAGAAFLWGMIEGYVTDPQFYMMIWDWITADPWGHVLNILAVWAALHFSITFVRWWYAEHSAKGFVYMRVELTRDDSKLDNEKRTEKDFKEKVAIMQQLYRAIFEISELNIWNIIKTATWQNEFVSFEMFLERKELHFYVVTLPYYQALVEKQITSFYPNANVFIEHKPYLLRQRGNKINGFYFHLKNRFEFPIKMYDTMEHDPLNDLANVLSKLEEGETAAYQIVCHPVPDSSWRKQVEDFAGRYFKKQEEESWWFHIPIFGWFLKVVHNIFSDRGLKDLNHGPGADKGDAFIRMIQPKEEAAKHIGEKAGESGFEVAIRVVASAKTSERVEDIINSMIAAMNVFKDSYANYFEGRRVIFINWINWFFLYHGFQKRLIKFFNKTSLLCSKELAGLYHFPDAHFNQVPVIQWMTYKVLPPPSDMAKSGLLLGNNVFRSQTTPVYISQEDRSRHFYIIGKSGSGKSALLSFMARQDAQNGAGFALIDPHGDLVEDVLRFIPKERVKDVIVFNPGDRERPMALNILEAHTDEDKDRASLDAMQIFIKLYGNEIFGPRIQHYFRNGCLTLMDDEEGATLLDVPRLFVDEEFQKRKVARCKNNVVRQFWENEIAKTGQREKEEMIPYFSAKFGPFVTNTTMRNIIGQPKSSFNIREIMDSGKILLVNLSKGLIGDVNAQLLGLIMVNKISMAAMSRADMDERDRKPFYLYVDEFQNFATDAFADILSEARKYKLALIMAHQYIAQITQGSSSAPGAGKDSKIKDAVFGNVGTMMSFKVGAEDGEYLEKEYAPLLSQQDIIGVANYKAYLKLNINNTTSRPFSLETIWAPGGSDKVAAIVKEYSRLQYGRKKVFVDQEIEARLGIK